MYYTPYINCHFSEQHFYHSQKTFDAKNLLAILQSNLAYACDIVPYSFGRTYHAIVPLYHTV